MVKVVKVVFLTLLFILGITFSMENRQELVLRYYFGLETPPIPLFLLVLFSILLGVLLAGVGFIIDEWSLRRALREKEREITALRREFEPYLERQRALGEGERGKEAR